MQEEKFITYDDELEKIKTLLLKDTLDEDEKYFLSLFAMDLCHRQLLVSNDVININDLEMQNDLKKSLTLLQSAWNNKTIAAKYLIDIYNKYYTQRVQKSLSSQSSSNNNGISNEKALVRAKTITGAPTYANPEENSDNSLTNESAGFSSIILILLTTIACGLFLATLLL